MKRLFLILIIAILLFSGGAIGFLVLRDRQDKYAVSLEGVNIPQFSSVEVDFKHDFEWSRGLPYAAGAIIDVDNDGRDELFLGGGVRQSDGLFVFLGDHFVNVADQAGLVKQGGGVTLGAVVLDIDDNGFQDLIVSREKGIWLYFNRGGKFEMEKLDLEMPSHGVPLAVSVTDLNHDGHFDFFLPMVRETSWLEWLKGETVGEALHPRLYINNGDNSFYNLTEGAGLGSINETFQAMFVDLNDDKLEDLFALHTDGSISIWQNRGNLLFESKSHFYESLHGQFMGMTVGDYDNNGKVDFLLTNRGETLPQAGLRFLGSRKAEYYTKWVLMKNSGYFSFAKDADRARLADYELARGALFTDMNNDGRLDLVVSQNHPYWPPRLLKSLRLSGRAFLQNAEGQFGAAGQQTHITDTGFGVTPLLADFNQDGRPDIVMVRLGGKTRVFLSKPAKAHFIKVQVPDSVSSIGATVTVKTLSGLSLRQTYLIGKELCSDSSHTLFFGLDNDKATDVIIEYSDGRKDQTSGVLFNTTVTFE